jgi:hypothetical protein
MRAWAWWAVLAVYLALRVAAWHSTVLVEDHGSISQFVRAGAFLSLDPSRIYALEPDTTPFYPLGVALFSLPGWSLETAARLCSLVFSVGLFAAVAALGKRLWDGWAALAALLLLAVNPVMAGLSYAIITEPSYIATVYVGLALFWWQMDRPTPLRAAALGLVFGLAFLNRVEGLLFLGAVVLAQAVHFAWIGRRTYAWRTLAGWTVAYVVAFALVAAPQIWWVSRRMGQFAINGREVWSVVLVQRDGKSYEQKVYGLDYSPREINLEYLQRHPEAFAKLYTSPSPRRYARLAVRNAEELYRVQLAGLVGPVALVLAGAGLLAMVQRGRGLQAFLLVGFVAVGLVGPLLHNVVMRHVAVVAPAILLLAGVGIRELAEGALGSGRAGGRRWGAAFVGLAGVAAIGWLPQLRGLFSRETCNREYCDGAIRQAARTARAVADSVGKVKPIVASRKQYLPYAAGGETLPLPATDLPGLVRYLSLNHADFAYFERWQLGDRAFADATTDELRAHGLVLLERTTDARGRVSELYRFTGPTAGTPPAGPP